MGCQVCPRVCLRVKKKNVLVGHVKWCHKLVRKHIGQLDVFFFSVCSVSGTLVYPIKCIFDPIKCKVMDGQDLLVSKGRMFDAC